MNPLSPLHRLADVGQSVWMDYLRRAILENGELGRMIERWALRGLTSNPAIFEEAVDSGDYDALLESQTDDRVTAEQIYERFAVEDIRAAADVFRPIYEASDGVDGYVSLEVSPLVAYDTRGTFEAARRLWQAVGRPNVMIKVPGNAEGLPAIEELLYEGIPINITLLFSVSNYEEVVDAYLRALERRARAGLDVRVASVASFFVSRVDTAVDALLDARLAQERTPSRQQALEALRGQIAVANAKRAYRRFREWFDGPRFAALRERGARVQRPLWASMSTKDPRYSDVKYVEALIGPDTVATLPPATLEAFADHGHVRATLLEGWEEAEAQLARLAELGIDLDEVTEQLQEEGIEKFARAYRSLLQTIDSKRKQVVGRRA